MKVLVDGKTVTLTGRHLLGQGGEAEVYAYGRKQVIKVFKQPDHADYASDPHAAAAARARLAEHQRKLVDFPAGLPAAVIAPASLASCPRRGDIVGYAMPRIRDAEPLYTRGGARARRAHGLASQVAALRSLHDLVTALHAKNIVIGDFNDLNVLVRDDDAYLIDADSLQFGGYGCSVFSERFVDPRLCGAALSPIKPFDRGSDWYAFAVMAVRTLLSVEPHGGVHQPVGSNARVPAHRRALERVSIFNAPVRLPRPALPPTVLSGDLRAYLEGVFARDERAPMPRSLLECLSFTRCASCGLEHARRRCPACVSVSVPTPAPAPSPVRAQVIIDPSRVRALRARAASRGRATGRVWLDGRRLMRRGRFGPEHIGDVMAEATRLWVGERFGVGFYAAGRLNFGFVFDVERGGLNDQLPLPPRRGTLATATAALAETRAWLFLQEQIGPVLASRLHVASATGRLVASGQPDPRWIAGLPGACAVGHSLLVPTDDGVIRLDVDAGQIVVGKTFPETADAVDAATTLIADAGALYAIGATTITALTAG